jgi:hypothetical protein
VRETARRFEELREFSLWVDSRLAPQLPQANARALSGAPA